MMKVQKTTDSFVADDLARSDFHAVVGEGNAVVDALVISFCVKMVSSGGNAEERTNEVPAGLKKPDTIAGRLKDETTVSEGWIADRLKMDTVSYDYSLLFRKGGRRSNDKGSYN